MTTLDEKIVSLSENKQKLLALLKKKKQAELLAKKKQGVAPFELISKEDRALCGEDVVDAYPLSMLQMGMLYHMNMADSNTSLADYHNLTTFRCRIEGEFNPALFQQALDKITDEHENLRTSFDLVNFSQPLQLVHKSARIPMGYEDLRALSEDKKEAIIKQYIKAENADVFDCSKAPLMRFYIHHIEDDVISLSFTEPHSISDGWSTHLTIVDIFDIYFALIEGKTHTLVEPQSRYVDFIKAELDVLNSPEAHAFWDEKLAQSAQTKVPYLGREIAEQITDNYSHKQPYILERDLAASLHSVVEQTGIPMKNIFLAVHCKMLSMITGQDVVTTGLSCNGRLETENSTQMRGLFLNTLPINMDLSGDDSWRELLQQAYQAEMDLVPFRRFPFGLVQQKYGKDPVYYTHISFLHFHSMADTIGEKKIQKIDTVDLSKKNFDLSSIFSMDPADKYQIHYLGDVNLDKVSKRQFVVILQYYIRLMEDLVANLDEKHKRKEFLSSTERSQMLSQWSNQKAAGSLDTYIHQQFEKIALEHSDKVAANFGEKQITYAQLNANANQLAGYLREQGVTTNQLVAICLDRSIATVVAQLAVLKAGGAYVIVSPASSKAQQDFLFGDSGAQVLISEPCYQSGFAARDLNLICLDSHGEAQDARHYSAENLGCDGLLSADKQLAYVSYDFDRRGQAVGIQVSHENVVSLVLPESDMKVSAEDVVAQASHVGSDSAAFECWASLLNGASLIGIETSTLSSGALLKAEIEKHKISHLYLDTADFNQLVLTHPDALAGLTTLYFGGDGVALEGVDKLLGAAAPKQLIHVYGPSHVTAFATAYRFDKAAFDSYPSAPIGQAKGNCSTYVLNKHRQLVPQGTAGELYIGGAGVPLGYQNCAQLATKHFIQNPFSDDPKDILYKTGDLVRFLNTGDLEYVGHIGDNDWSESELNKQSNNANASGEFWLKLLGDVDEPTLPFNLTTVRKDQLDSLDAQVPNAIAEQIRVAAKAADVTPVVLFNVAWAMVVASCSGRDDVVFGTAISGRLPTGVQVNSVNTVPLRVNIAQLSVSEVVSQTDKLLDELIPLAQSTTENLSSVSSLFSAAMSYSYGVTDESLAGLIEAERSNYPMSLSVNDNGTGFEFAVQIDDSVSAARIVEYLQNALAKLALAVTDKPQQRLHELSVLPQDELNRQVVLWNDTKTDDAQELCVHELIEAYAEKTPDAPGVIFRNRQLSFAQMNAKANQLARYLIAEKQVKPDTLVGICVERSLEMVVGMLAILKAGGGYVCLDPEYPEARLDYMVKDANLTMVLTQTHLCNTSVIGDNLALALDDAQLQAKVSEYSQDNIAPESIGLTAKNLAYVIYTSGSTGRPKGVMVEHRSLHNYCCALKRHCDDVEGSYVNTNICFDGTATSYWLPLCAGKYVKLATVSNAEALNELLTEANDASANKLFKITPSHLDILADEQGSADTQHTFFVGGELFSPEKYKRLPANIRTSNIFNHYGPSEATVGCMTHPILSERDLTRGSIPLGRPIANVELHILDNYRQVLPIGVAGELYIGGSGLARGYLNLPQMTSEKFIDNPFYNSENPQRSERLYKTGDLVRRLPGGEMEFVGRIDHQVKIRGFRIELGEIEHALRSHTKVNDAIVMAKDSGMGDSCLVAYVATDEAVRFARGDAKNLRHDFIEMLRQSLSQDLPEYMVPWAFVLMEQFPLTPNDKIDRRALPEPDMLMAQTEYVAPKNDIEEKLVAIWAKLFKQDGDKISTTANFFEIGGHSLLSVRLAAEIQSVWDVSIGIAVLFEKSTIEQLGHLINNELLREKVADGMEIEW